MALRPGRQRRGATPIIAKGVVYPPQNPRASKSDSHGFASKSDTRHNKKSIAIAVLFLLVGDGAHEDRPRIALMRLPHLHSTWEQFSKTSDSEVVVTNPPARVTFLQSKWHRFCGAFLFFVFGIKLRKT